MALPQNNLRAEELFSCIYGIDIEKHYMYLLFCHQPTDACYNVLLTESLFNVRVMHFCTLVRRAVQYSSSFLYNKYLPLATH